MHNRKSIRLKKYDYSQQGGYFITICTQNRARLFGNIHEGIMRLSPPGMMISSWWNILDLKFNNIALDEYIVMPNHLHGIVFLVGAEGGHTGPPLQIPTPMPKIIQWYKTMTTNAYIYGVKSKQYPPFNKKLWQRNYYERIIRNYRELQNIRTYIQNNPTNV